MTVALVHDYLTQRGGAERVVLSLTRAFPDAPLYTSLYDPEGTFPDFRSVDVRPLPLNRLAPLRKRHRAALPVLALTFSRAHIAADKVLCSSSGWAHGIQVDGRKIVYCHTPARWLYQTGRYVGSGPSAARLALAPLRRVLTRWDRRAARSAHRYLANSNEVRKRIRDIYGLEAEVVPPPHGIDPDGPRRPLAGLEPGFALCVSRLLPYKNVAAVVEAFAGLPDRRLVVVGEGPEDARLRALAPSNTSLVGAVADDLLRWLYASCSCLVSASYEDYGLTPLEAAAFGKPAAVLRFGGFEDTVTEGVSGVFFAEPAAAAIATAVEELEGRRWDAEAIRRHAACFSETAFVDRIRGIVSES